MVDVVDTNLLVVCLLPSQGQLVADAVGEALRFCVPETNYRRNQSPEVAVLKLINVSVTVFIMHAARQGTSFYITLTLSMSPGKKYFDSRCKTVHI